MRGKTITPNTEEERKAIAHTNHRRVKLGQDSLVAFWKADWVSRLCPQK